MTRKKVIYIVILFLMASCGNRNNDKVSISVLTDYGEVPFKLWVDDTIRYDGKYKYGRESEDWEMMVTYIEKKDTLRTFRIQMMDKDTTFIHDMTGVYKLHISVLSERGYAIFDNYDMETWFAE